MKQHNHQKVQVSSIDVLLIKFIFISFNYILISVIVKVKINTVEVANILRFLFYLLCQ